jgi:hypothetical protein
MKIVSWCAAALVGLALAAGCGNKPGSGGSADTSSPKSTANAFAKAVDSGDVATAQAVTVNDPDQQKAVEALVNTFSATKDFAAAVKDKLGDQGAAMAKGITANIPNLSDTLKDGTETVTGDTATVSSKKADGTQDPDPPHFKKVDGKWLVDMSASKDWNKMKGDIDQMNKQAQQMKDITAKIKSGEIKDMTQLNAAMQGMH